MGHSDPYEVVPDVVISGTLAADLVEALDFARGHSESHGGYVASLELACLRLRLVAGMQAAEGGAS